jgi:hypothetical protein
MKLMNQMCLIGETAVDCDPGPGRLGKICDSLENRLEAPHSGILFRRQTDGFAEDFHEPPVRPTGTLYQCPDGWWLWMTLEFGKCERHRGVPRPGATQASEQYVFHTLKLHRRSQGVVEPIQQFGRLLLPQVFERDMPTVQFIRRDVEK